VKIVHAAKAFTWVDFERVNSVLLQWQRTDTLSTNSNSHSNSSNGSSISNSNLNCALMFSLKVGDQFI